MGSTAVAFISLVPLTHKAGALRRGRDLRGRGALAVPGLHRNDVLPPHRGPAGLSGNGGTAEGFGPAAAAAAGCGRREGGVAAVLACSCSRGYPSGLGSCERGREGGHAGGCRRCCGKRRRRRHAVWFKRCYTDAHGMLRNSDHHCTSTPFESSTRKVCPPSALTDSVSQTLYASQTLSPILSAPLRPCLPPAARSRRLRASARARSQTRPQPPAGCASRRGPCRARRRRPLSRAAS